jgi:predicted phosphodiesterase
MGWFHWRVLGVIVLSTIQNWGVEIDAHDGPDPVAHWRFEQVEVDGLRLNARLGPDAFFSSKPRFVDESIGQSIEFRRGLSCVVADDYRDAAEALPRESFTVSLWAAINQGEPWGGLVGTIEDNGDQERGWLVGYNEQSFVFGLSTEGVDDPDGKMTYLAGKTPWESGKLYHVVAVYDGQQMQLFVNGRLDASSDSQSGPIRYPSSAPLVLGGYRDQNEDYRLDGRIAEVAIYDLAAKENWVQHEFQHGAQLAAQEARLPRIGEGFVVHPYLQFGTRQSMTVMWRTSLPANSTVRWGETTACDQAVVIDEMQTLHEVVIDGLEPETQYFYMVESLAEDSQLIESEVLTFSTAVNESTPYAFAIIGDTQGNPEVSAKLAAMAWDQRPNFCLHVGDLVSTGTNDLHWTEHFFPGMKSLIERVPFYPVLGNHEQNARNYFDYVSLPSPEYYYSFTFGNAEFFMIDSNRNIDPESEQYQWLDSKLEASTSCWKIVCHHHPPFSSDENDYGDLWKTNKSSRGDMRARQLTTLYDRHGVDIVWNGHIHSYERTWPVRHGTADADGTVYIVTGGGGGGLETPGPFRPYFQNNVKRGHHYCLVAVNGGTFELKAFDLDGRLFDTVTLVKEKDAE